MKMIEFRVPSVHAGQTTDTPVFVNADQVVSAEVTQEDPPAVRLFLAGGHEVSVAGTADEVFKALGAKPKEAKVKEPEGDEAAANLEGVKSEEERLRDGQRFLDARGDFDGDRPADNGEGRERRVPTADGYKPEAPEEKDNAEKKGVRVRRG